MYIQKGFEQTPDKEGEAGPPEEQGSPGVVLIQQGRETKESKTNMTAEMTKQRGVWTNKQGKPIICF